MSPCDAKYHKIAIAIKNEQQAAAVFLIIVHPPEPAAGPGGLNRSQVYGVQCNQSLAFLPNMLRNLIGIVEGPSAEQLDLGFLL